MHESVQIRSFFWSVFSCIRTEYGDLRSTKVNIIKNKTLEEIVFYEFYKMFKNPYFVKHQRRVAYTFFWKIFCLLKWNMKGIKHNCFSKIYKNLFNVLRQRSYYYYIDILICKSGFSSKKHWFLKTRKASYIPPNSLLYLRKYLKNKNKNYISLVRKNWSFCDQICYL